jgi:hypothetical protein
MPVSVPKNSDGETAPGGQIDETVERHPLPQHAEAQQDDDDDLADRARTPIATIRPMNPSAPPLGKGQLHAGDARPDEGVACCFGQLECGKL